VIVGGGVIGLSIAWRSAQQGMRVVVADPAPGQGATHAAAGMLTPIAEAAYAEREVFALGLDSLRRYPAFAAELEQATGLPTGFRQTGTLQVAYDSDDLAVLDELRALQDSFGVQARQLTARQCREAEPMLDPAIRGGLLAADDGSVDPRLLAAALLRAATAAGARHVPMRVAEILTEPEACAGPGTRTGTESPQTGTVTTGAEPGQRRASRVSGVRLSDGSELAAPALVLAAGWNSAGFAGLPPGCAPPVRPVKGQILRLRSTVATAAAGLPPGLLRRTVRGIVRGSSVYLVPRESGELVIGATQEELGSDTTVTAGGVWELLRDARALVPGITELALADMTAGLRPGTPDNAPLLGPAALPGLVLATGHFRAGVLLTPVTADTISRYLLTGQPDPLWAAFGADRFAGGGGLRWQRPAAAKGAPAQGAAAQGAAAQGAAI
jgi:glycine/D-amino acid oxidase-like deaminating enzyme